jgi:hypothetical protein
MKSISLKKLTAKGALDALFNGDIIIIKGYEKTYDANVLVKLDQTRVPLTVISYNTDITIANWSGTYWALHDVSLNTLSLYPVYLMNENYTEASLYPVGATVYYTNETTGKEDSALIEDLLKADDDTLSVQLSAVTEPVPVDKISFTKMS